MIRDVQEITIIREMTETRRGQPVELTKPETAADVAELNKSADKGNVAVGTSHGDLEPDTEQELVAAGMLEADERE